MHYKISTSQQKPNTKEKTQQIPLAIAIESSSASVSQTVMKRHQESCQYALDVIKKALSETASYKYMTLQPSVTALETPVEGPHGKYVEPEC